MKLATKTILQFQKTIWDYYRKHGRRFPWRPPSSACGEPRAGKRDLDPYSVLVSEVMLQQTQVDRVIPKYLEWIQQFPNLESLAKAPLKRVLQAWSGLGYNRRALFLKRAAEIIVREHGGEVPRDLEKLDALQGIGRATAAAILAYAWDEPVAFVETNIRAAFIHHFFPRGKKVSDTDILELVAQTLPLPHLPHTDKLEFVRMSLRGAVWEWYSALMDYGSMLKARYGNPNVRSAQYVKQKKFADSRRELRGKILRRATRQKTIAPSEFSSDAFSVPEVLRELVREGFLRKERRRFCLA